MKISALYVAEVIYNAVIFMIYFSYPHKHICFEHMSCMMMEYCGKTIKCFIKSEKQFPEECARERVIMGQECIKWTEEVWEILIERYTKASIYAVERMRAIQRAGFIKSEHLLIGKTGYAYDGYWITK